MPLSQYVLQYEISIRLICFFSVFILMALWEVLAPKRTLRVSKSRRWLNNGGLVILNSVILRLLFPLAAVGVAAYAEHAHWGLIPLYQLPCAILLSIVILDLIIYLQHVLMHALPILWRVHRVHHADLDFDVTTGSRFHPIEIVLSMLIKFAAIILIGAPVLAVIIFEVILNAMSMFNHSNVRLAQYIDEYLRVLLVTPDMHRVHHSVIVNETNSNFGFNLSIWDRLMGTYCQAPSKGHQDMTIGIDGYRDTKQVIPLKGLLLLPFFGKINKYAIHCQEKFQVHGENKQHITTDLDAK